MKLLTPADILLLTTKYADNDEVLELCDCLMIHMEILTDMGTTIELQEIGEAEFTEIFGTLDPSGNGELN